MTTTTPDSILTLGLERDARDAQLCDLLSITGPGACALREPDGRVMVWSSSDDSVDDDGARAIYRSRAPISDAAWDAIAQLAWVADAESA